MAVAAEREAKLFDPTKLASYDARSVPISFQIRADDPRFFPDFDQWKQEPVGVSVGARTLKVRADVFKHATHVPFDASLLGVKGEAHASATHENQSMYTNSPDNLPKPMSPWVALGIGAGGVLDAALGYAAIKSKSRIAKGAWLTGNAFVLGGCLPTANTPPAAEMSPIPAEVTQVAPATPTVEVTKTPPPGFQTETPVAPVDIKAGHPDYHDASVGGVSFTHGATEAQISDKSNPLKLPEYALTAYSDNIKAIQDKVDGEQSAQVFWNSKYDRNFVLLTRVESGVTQVAVIAAGEGNFSYHPNAEWFDFAATENAAYTWVALPDGVTQADLVGGYFGYYPVWGIQKASEKIPSQLFVPGAEHGFEQNPAKPVEVAKFSIDSLELAPEVAAALKKHPGLEASIVMEASGTTAEITYWDANHKLVTEKVNVDPTKLTEDTKTTNELGNTPVLLTADGQKLYWADKHKAWFKVEIGPDINNPTLFVPYEYLDVATRVIVTEFNAPFSQAAIDRWNKYPGLMLDFEFLNVNANTNENTRFASIGNRSTTEDGLTADNGAVQVLDAWINVGMPDGTVFEAYPTKWLDPINPKKPQGTDWKVFWAANGQEIMGDAANRQKFDALLATVGQNGSRTIVSPIVAADANFFNSTNNLFTFGVAQPSLAKLLTLPGNQIGPLPLPNRPTDTFGNWIKNDFAILNANTTSIAFCFNTNQDADYLKNFFPSDMQTMLFPSIVVSR